MQSVKLLHLSDTHNMHWSIESKFGKLPDADIFIHTGDFSNHGTDEEFADFVAWLRTIKDRYFRMVVILGNHDWWETAFGVERGTLHAGDVVAAGFMQRKFESFGLPENCTILEHAEEVVMGLRIWGSSWVPWHPDNWPEHVCSRVKGRQLCFQAFQQINGTTAPHRFDEIPAGIDILLTHGPATGIMDCIGTPGKGWGSSRALRDAVYRARPCMHLFGHLHEQRGVWRNSAGGFEGGIEYKAHPGAPPYVTTGPPPGDYPCSFISCNAMSNNSGIENVAACIAGGPRLIHATPRVVSDVGGSQVHVSQVQMHIVNVGRQRCLTSRDGKHVVTEDQQAALSGNRWLIISCPHEAGSVYIVESSSGKFLDTHGSSVQIWNNGGCSIADVIAGNISQYASNLRWTMINCRHQTGSFYIVNTGHQKFLDAYNHQDIQVWNNNGRTVEEVIAGNTSVHAANLRWALKPV